jgi:hypothetical protein
LLFLLLLLISRIQSSCIVFIGSSSQPEW